MSKSFQEARLLLRIATNALTVCISVVVALLLLEAVIRIGGETDADGQFSFMGIALEPYALPVNQLRAGVEGYIANKDISAVIYDEKLGWTYRPNSIRQAGTFTINDSGLRSTRDYTPAPPADTLRIALFGDSFTAGDDVDDEEVWGHQLENLLVEAGLRAEVLNFGAGAYGMDQAFLRWIEQGKSFAPDIVIFGLQPENLARNVNVFRQLLHGSGPPFSKPRFIVNSQHLQLINSPTLPPEQLVSAFEDFSNHPLAPYEHHYVSRFVVTNWWASSRLASFLYALIAPDAESPSIYEEGSEAGQLGKRIVDAFAADALEQNSTFIVLHLPLQSHLINHFSSFPPPQQRFRFLLDHVRENNHYLATEERIGQDHLDDVYWSATKHYGPAIHRIVAEVAAEYIIDCAKSGACPLPRFNDLAVFLASDASAGP